jgi:hypothetical protein
MTEEHTPTPPPIKIAFILDGKVADILHTDERLASIFLSNPTIVDVTDFIAQNENIGFIDATWDEATSTLIPTQEQLAAIEESKLIAAK